MKPSNNQPLLSDDSAQLYLPPEVEEQIFRALSEDARALCRCALVSRRWLHHSRTQFFTTRSVDLSVDEYDFAGISKLFESSFLAKEANRGQSSLTLGAYILQVRLRASSIDIGWVSPEEREHLHRRLPNRMIQYTLTQCPNLRNLTLEDFDCADISADSADIIRSLSHLEMISFHDVTFTVDQLLNTLHGLQPSIRTCHLQLCRVIISSRLSHLPNPQIEGTVNFHIALRTDSSAPVQFLLWVCDLNVCSFDFIHPRPTIQQMKLQASLLNRYSSTLSNIRTRLGEFHTGHASLPSDRPNYISLQGLASLQSFDVGIIRPPSYLPPDTATPEVFSPGRWLCELIRTLPLESSGFSRLAFGLSPLAAMHLYRGDSAQAKAPFSYPIENSNWKLVADELMNPVRFPSGPPLVDITFLRMRTRIFELDEEREATMRRQMREMEEYLERIHRVGKLIITVSDDY